LYRTVEPRDADRRIGHSVVVARSSVFGGRLVAHDAVPALAVEGVRHVVPIDNAVAVVADTTWGVI
jgi:isoquinoline 1-oxidoreductase beta subunit